MKAYYTATLVVDYDDELVPAEISTGIEYTLSGITVVYQEFMKPLPNGRKTRSAIIDQVRNVRPVI